MPKVRLALLSISALALAACLRPVEQRRAHDTGVLWPDGGSDAGEIESADGSCLTCLPDCAPTCTNGDAGCPFIAQPMHDLGCPASGFSLVTNGVRTISSPRGGSAATARARSCAATRRASCTCSSRTGAAG